MIKEAIKQMKETRYGVINHKWFEISIQNDNWLDQYHISVKDTSSDKYIYEASIHCKNDVLLYKNLEIIIDYIGE